MAPWRYYLPILLIVSAMLFAALAQDAPPAAVPLGENVVLKIENLRLREEMIRLEREALFRNVCAAAGIPAGECLIDPAAKLVKRVPPTKEK
jgi:hypothetical protein